jgi:hypothetical protein
LKFYVKSEKTFQRSFKRLNFEKLVHNVLTFYRFNNHGTGTWDLVPLPSHAIHITCKWVFKIKTKSDGSVERYKTRLVARDFQ